jgi:hypothetical protein
MNWNCALFTVWYNKLLSDPSHAAIFFNLLPLTLNPGQIYVKEWKPYFEVREIWTQITDLADSTNVIFDNYYEINCDSSKFII